MSNSFGRDDFLGTYMGQDPDQDAWLLVDSVRFLPNPDDLQTVKIIVSRFNLECPINYELREDGAHKGLVPYAIRETLKAWPNVIRNMQYLAAELNFSRLALELSKMSLEQINLDATTSLPSIGVVVPLRQAPHPSQAQTPNNPTGLEAQIASRPRASAVHQEHDFFVLNT